MRNFDHRKTRQWCWALPLGFSSFISHHIFYLEYDFIKVVEQAATQLSSAEQPSLREHDLW